MEDENTGFRRHNLHLLHSNRITTSKNTYIRPIRHSYWFQPRNIPHKKPHRKCMLLLGCTITFLGNPACNSSLTQNISTPLHFVKPVRYKKASIQEFHLIDCEADDLYNIKFSATKCYFWYTFCLNKTMSPLQTSPTQRNKLLILSQKVDI